ncbi:MAG: hypothetical protein ACLKAK_07735 [Alkaliphilus sp.]
MYLLNDLMYVCGVIEEISRRINSSSVEVVQRLGKEGIGNLYEFADVYHCMSLDEVIVELQGKVPNLLKQNSQSNRETTKMPNAFTVGLTFATVIKAVGAGNLYEDMIAVYSSILDTIVRNYDSDGWYSGTNYLAACYKAGEILET